MNVWPGAGEYILLCIIREKGQVECDCKPVAINNKQEGYKGMDSSFRDDIGV